MLAGIITLLTKYESDHQKYPERIMYASESFHYDAYDYWKAVEKYPYVIGDFVWTSMDYIGEVPLEVQAIHRQVRIKLSEMPPGFKLPSGY